MKNRLYLFPVLLIFCFLASNVNASLISRGTDTSGNQLIYDDVLDITWYDYSEGTMLWQDAVTWADNLTVTFGTNVYDKWRLPNLTDTRDEWSDLWFNTLGNSSMTDDEYHQYLTDNGGASPYNKNPFLNLNKGGAFGDFNEVEDWYYWYGTGSGESGDFFLFLNGFRDNGDDPEMSNYAVAVIDGDVTSGSSPVPEPATILLLGVGLLGLAGVGRKKK